MKTASPHELVPASVVEQYIPNTATSIEMLSGGIVNTTAVMTNEATADKYVIQKIHPIIDPTQTVDYNVIAGHLRRVGWEIPALVQTTAGTLYHTDQTGAHWRTFEFIDSDNNSAQPRVNHEKFSQLGALLGKLHLSLQTLDYIPQFKIPHFHETLYFAETLDRAIPHITHADVRKLAHVALKKFELLPELPKLPDQIIHADPKVENVLCRDAIPFTFIDWDTAMTGSPWIDIGDMIRSVSKGPVPALVIQRMIESYRLASGADQDSHDFLVASLESAAAVTIELALRYILDSNTDDESAYFGWDNQTYSSRVENNMAKASLGLKSYEKLLHTATQHKRALPLIKPALISNLGGTYMQKYESMTEEQRDNS